VIVDLARHALVATALVATAPLREQGRRHDDRRARR
jgi:hypothetical protein